MVHHTVSLEIGNRQVQTQELKKVVIAYPKDWTKAKYMRDGDVKEVSPEVAKTFIEAGIATYWSEETPKEQKPIKSDTVKNAKQKK